MYVIGGMCFLFDVEWSCLRPEVGIPLAVPSLHKGLVWLFLESEGKDLRLVRPRRV